MATTLCAATMLTAACQGLEEPGYEVASTQAVTFSGQDEPLLPTEGFAAFIDWRMQDTFVDWDGDGLPDLTRDWNGDGVMEESPHPSLLTAREWTVWLDGCKSASTTGYVTSYQWTIELPSGTKVVNSKLCDTAVSLPEGQFKTTLVLTNQRGETTSTSRSIKVRNYLIVAMGDSVSSGEGNPDRPIRLLRGQDGSHKNAPPKWADRQCHRSSWAGAAQAAAMLERSDPRSSVTFLGLGCSGASIYEGLIGEYAGQERVSSYQEHCDHRGAHCTTTPVYFPSKRSQIRAAAATVCGPAGCLNAPRRIDAVLLNVGANDVAFGDVVRECAVPYDTWPLGKDCDRNDDLKAKVSRGLSLLPDSYRQLDVTIRSMLNPRAILIAEYFDPTQTTNGNCQSMVFNDAVEITYDRTVDPILPYTFVWPNVTAAATALKWITNQDDGRIDFNEIAWARDNVVKPLNDVIRNAASANGWTHVGGIASDFAKAHGYCADDHWIVRYNESFAAQGREEGTMHPNRVGHAAIANRFLESLRRVLGQVPLDLPVTPEIVGPTIFIGPEYGYESGGWRVGRHPRFLADMNGDQKVDIIGMADAGVVVSQGRTAGFGPSQFNLAQFGAGPEGGNWDAVRHPRLVADMDRDGNADIVGFAEAGVHIGYSNKITFVDSYVLAAFGASAGGWDGLRHPRVVADVDGNNLLDIIGFAEDGVHVSRGRVGRSFDAPVLASTAFGAKDGWSSPQYTRLVADITGDLRADIVAFGYAGVTVALGTPAGTFGAPFVTLPTFGGSPEAGGWDQSTPRMLADVTGDGYPDIVGFGKNGVDVAVNLGAGNFQAAVRWSNTFGSGAAAGGWGSQHPRALVDLDGDRKMDVVGFGYEGVVISLSSGLRFGPPVLALRDYGVQAAWDTRNNPRLLGDANGDGRPDIVGFAYAGTIWTPFKL
ncbi:MAG: FG-GAP-like repeat-containing protein [Deltaproteobacteria bacterium]|nr:FG-GAP-like repeat-containing protein [Deltaproteobacteria bacterium]